MNQSKEVDDYIGQFPDEIQQRLQAIRETIRQAVPEAEEVISYMMTAYKLHSVLVYFAGYKKHVGFYPTPNGIAAFQEEVNAYKWAKGSVQFPHSLPLPHDLVRKMVAFRVDEDREMAAMKKKK